MKPIQVSIAQAVRQQNDLLSKVRTGHVLAVKMEDGTEALAWVEQKKWMCPGGQGRAHSIDWNPHTEGTTPYIRVVWFKATGVYVQAWHAVYGTIMYPCEARLPDRPGVDGIRFYGDFRLLEREEVLSLHLEWVYGPDRHETVRQTMVRAYDIEAWKSGEDRMRALRQRELAEQWVMALSLNRSPHQLDLWVESEDAA